MKRKIARTLCIALSMILCLCVGAFAGSNVEAISAQLNRSISIQLNGETQTMYDAQGTRVYPISYKGTTYVPIRAVSNMLGIAVDWDAATQTVLLGSSASTAAKPYEIKNGTLFDGSTAKSFSVLGESHTTGFTLRGRSISSESYALLSTGGKSLLSFDVGHVDGTGDAKLDLGVYLDDTYLKTIDISATQGIKHVEIDLNGASVVKLHFIGAAGYFSGEYGFFNLQLS